MEWIKKHISLFVIIIIVTALILPIFINALHLVDTDCEILHKPSEWTVFWGSYLGAIISAGVAFAILYIQRKDNEKQNKENRNKNETQNKSNRQLQFNIMKYQQQSHWLDNFRIVSLEYCHSFNYNDIVLISNTMWNYPDEAFNMMKPLFERATKCNANFSFVRKQDESANELNDYIDSIYTSYKQVLIDLQWITLYYKSTFPTNRDQQSCISFLRQQYKTQKDLNHIIQVLEQPYYGANHRKYFENVVQNIILESKSNEPNVRDKIYEYIKQEQERIDNILTDNIE